MSLFGYFYNLNVTRETVLRVVSGLNTGFSGVGAFACPCRFFHFFFLPTPILSYLSILSVYLVPTRFTYLRSYLQYHLSLHEVITTLSISRPVHKLSPRGGHARESGSREGLAISDGRSRARAVRTESAHPSRDAR